MLEDLEVVWDYLAPEVSPEPSDVIFCFGSYHFGIARRAAALYQSGVAPRVLITGGVLGRIPPFETEADGYLEVLHAAGVPDCDIVVERHATNTGENVALGMRALLSAGHEINAATLVSWPTSLRRSRATFGAQYPQVRTTCVPAFAGLGPYADDIPRALTTSLAELDRLDRYAALGFVARQVVPELIRDAAQRLRAHQSTVVGANA